MRRNGKIDFLRFVFSIVIMLHHLGMHTELFKFGDTDFRVINQGGFAVVFFFLVSGWLLANQKVTCDVNEIPQRTCSYLWRRYKQYMVWFIPAFLLNMVIDYLNGHKLANVLLHVIYNVPNIFMLQRIGFGYSEVYPMGYYVNAAWYLSALIICSLIIYPLLLFKKEWFTKIGAPIISIYGMFVLLNNYGRLRTPEGIYYPITVMCMGCIAHEITGILNKSLPRKYTIVTIRFFEGAIYLLALLYICSDLPFSFEFPMALLLMLAISISFSDASRSRLFNNKFCVFLGEASFPLYMLHEAIGLIYERIITDHGLDYNRLSIHIILYLLCIVVAFAAQLIYSSCSKKIART